jgi:hypothetical protein
MQDSKVLELKERYPSVIITSEAVNIAAELNLEITKDGITQAARGGRLGKVWAPVSATGTWRLDRDTFIAWVLDTEAHRTGPRREADESETPDVSA